jgi:hypothetical protein
MLGQKSVSNTCCLNGFGVIKHEGKNETEFLIYAFISYLITLMNQ